MRILIANRGEIARRIIRTAHRMGHETVAVFSEPDEQMPFVRDAGRSVPLGSVSLATTYLSVDRLLAAAEETSSDAVHPGYGFLSENAGFARAVLDAGLVWIGPKPDAISAMGSKIEARRIAAEAGVPVIPGFDETQDDELLQAAADRIGYPVLVKASAGGGGKGIRIVHRPEDFTERLAAAREEALRSFGDDRVIVERYITRPRHVEVQVVADQHGNVSHLGTRECSVQRRYQKLLEEAPAPNLSTDSRTGMQDSAVTLARQIGYDSVGTVEFVVDDETGDFFFLEMNTRLQVEHPVTEYVTGFDLVELQLRAAAGEVVAPDDVQMSGHAFEARINAEDAWADFAPQIGSVTDLVVPEGVRWDSGVVVGSEVSSHYDPMIAKLIVGGPDRETARRLLAGALDELVIGGLRTNTGFHRWLVDQPAIVDGRVTTRFLDETELPTPPEESEAATRAAVLWTNVADRRSSHEVWHGLGGFRLTPAVATRVVHLAGRDTHDVRIDSLDSERPSSGVVDVEGRRVVALVDGHSFTFAVLTPTERWAPAAEKGHGAADSVRAPFPGVVAEVRIEAGETVEPGQTLAVIEAMKMLHPLTAHGSGTVAEVRVAPGDTVASEQILITFLTQNGESE
ncbi:MAG: biotin carboxylase N-terminal domain-containing protein [Acidimicrobiia bacterium]